MRLNKIIGITILLAIFVSCKKDSNHINDDIKEPIFYYVGYSFSGHYNERDRKAILVVQDSIVNLSPNRSADAKVVYAQGKDVFVAGNEHYEEEKNRVVYWKNGVKEYLSSAVKDNSATAIYADNENIYVAGTIYQNKLPYQRLWINGGRKVNSGALAYSGIRAITVYEGAYYLAGQFAQAASIWHGKTMYTINNAPSEATYIHVENGEVLTMGYGNVDRNTDAAKVWKGSDEIFSYPVGARVSNILATMNGNDYYFVTNSMSEDGINVARAYKNTQLLYELNTGAHSVKAMAIYIFNDKVYVLGNLLNAGKSVPTLWIDGVPKTLFTEQDNIYLNHMYIIL
ncbi:hypothetical protein [Sphingobacterium corticibacterium]|uniref:Uncharacterized protein n=1 Tax=Sphingobacterium corticibacterium TaxID=2484746 RepID=A0A4Q6XPP5_9SPHI|nr:hypothetical protein [Sphingobacterium corticibacterium]RZF62233.1 hypothetical protein EWE74_05375 [Sphingobacterium corticibacterium]